MRPIQDKLTIVQFGQCSEREEDTVNNENYSGSLPMSLNPPQEVHD